MSEALRSRLYDWFCEHIDEPTAEYAMSCLSPVPVSELATKDDIARLETATKDDIARLDTAIERLDAKFEADRMRRDDQRDADRKEARHQFRWLAGIGVSILGVVVGLGIFS